MAKARVLLAVPTAGGMSEYTSVVCSRLAQRDDVTYVTATGRPADYVRNCVVRRALASDFSHVFLIDSDIEPPLDCLDRLLALDAPLATGRYGLLMADGLRWSVSQKDADGRYRLLAGLPSIKQPFAAGAAGAGCLLIRRDVVETVPWKWFHWVESRDGSQVSEDIFFFRKAGRFGYRVMVEPRVICRHRKQIDITSLLLIKEKQNVH